jgi:hypothetical protein
MLYGIGMSKSFTGLTFLNEGDPRGELEFQKQNACESDVKS